MKKIISFILILSISFTFEFADAIGKYGAVASSKEDASQIGIDVLKKGGNAIDAAVAVAFALSVTHPSAGNLGGGGFMIIRLANGKVTTIDFREKAPQLASKDMYLDDNGNVISDKSKYTSLASGIPGTVYGLGYAHEKYGSLPWDILIYPSINLAKFGFELDYHNTLLLNSNRCRKLLSNDSESKNIFIKNTPFQINELFVQRDLSNTLLRIAKYGYKEFYNGLTADYIIDCMQRTRGLISYADLVNYDIVEREPIKFTYRDYNIYSMPPPSSGGIALANILNQLENFDISSLDFHSSSHVHLVVEAEKRAYADRAEYLGDSDFIEIPINKLISKEYAFDRYSTISIKKTIPSKKINHGTIILDNESEETTHLSVVDRYGNSVSLTTTVNGWFGNGITVDNAGFLLNNEMDDFSAKPGFPNLYGLIGNEANAIEPNKRMLSSMTPTIIENPNGKLFLVLGTPGGSTIITTIVQILMNIIDFNMPIKEAVETKRFHHQWFPDIIQVEKNTFSKEILNKLGNYGHELKIRSSIGEVNCIKVDNNNLKHACSDSRRGGTSLAY